MPEQTIKCPNCGTQIPLAEALTEQPKEISKISTLITKLRKFLICNKIFFETVIATLLTVVLVIFGFYQNRINSGQKEIMSTQTNLTEKQIQIDEQQTELMTKQLEIQHQLNLPVFKVVSSVISGERKEFGDEDKIFVFNLGEAITELTCSHAVFFDIELFPIPKSRGPLSIPVVGYYFTQGSTEGEPQLLIVIQGYNNNRKFVEIQRGLDRNLKILPKKTEGYSLPLPEVINIIRRKYVQLDYRDRFGKPHRSYYQIAQNGQGCPMAEQDGQKIFALYRDSRAREFTGLNDSAILLEVLEFYDHWE